jgi:hypothetical protein
MIRESSVLQLKEGDRLVLDVIFRSPVFRFDDIRSEGDMSECTVEDAL